MRLAAQSAVAAALAVLALRLAGSGEELLEVISALLVLELNRDATPMGAGERLAGAAIGTLVGFAAIALNCAGAFAREMAQRSSDDRFETAAPGFGLSEIARNTGEIDRSLVSL